MSETKYMSHPIPGHDYTERHEEESKSEYNARRRKALGHKVMSPVVHNRPEFKEVRKAYQGINSTPAKAKAKSIARHKSKALKSRIKED